MKNGFSFILCYLSFSLVFTSCYETPDADAMRRELLRVREMNKNYVPLAVAGDQSPDSVMKEVVAYYDRHGTTIERMEAH